MYDAQDAIYFKRRAQHIEDCTTDLVREIEEEIKKETREVPRKQLADLEK